MPLTHVYLGDKLLTLASRGMGNGLALPFLDDRCSQSLGLSEYLSGGGGSPDFLLTTACGGCRCASLSPRSGGGAAPCLT